ncbi:PhzF family phenazine biosynthesis protein [Wukongibacter baidiensis]|uniref:PhzF family phenazine biosynthesis protein n=1 Tax=Wukongibacter baidiensis TaxID=1723361 RepID=UPI003D7F7CAB
MKINIKQVDAFTKAPFGGNPAGVVTDANNLSDELKQKIAREMNLSETAFVSNSKDADFKVQFFTPNSEVDLCGHATIATFSALYEEGKLDSNKNLFYQETKAGVLPVELIDTNQEKVFMMTQALPKLEEMKNDKAEIARLIGLNKEDLLDLPVMKVSTGIWWLVFGIKKIEKLSKVKPNLKLIEDFSRENNIVGIMPFCIETLDSKYDYHSRCFAPLVGVNEDPVCGTGNGCIASYMVFNNLISFDQSIDLIGEAGIEVHRPGYAYVSLEKSGNDITKVRVGGAAITILDGNLKI